MPRHKILRKKGAGSYERAPQAASLWSVSALGLLLVVGTLFLYGPVAQHDFINYDDHEYVTKNPHVTEGLSWQTVQWSLTATEQWNWHPLTWISHAIDCELFGLNASYHHVTSVVLHSFAALVLFFFLLNATSAAEPSFVVAALFAWHPLNVESVAWVAERKNVLSTFFFFLTLLAYCRHVRRPRLGSLVVVVLAFVLALASKPMAVSLPFVLLLLDYWPLRRMEGWTKADASSNIPQQPPSRLVLEKAPLFALAAASCAVTVWAQSRGAVQNLVKFPLVTRFENALYSYILYICKTFWPARLALFYPHPGIFLPAWKPALGGLLLCAISVAVWIQRTARPYLLVGWLWFLVTLVPVIGIVQVGKQGMADRYAYQPVIGLFLMIVWLAFDFLKRATPLSASRWLLLMFAPALLALLVVASRQLGYWKNSVNLWTHTLAVTNSNLLAETKLAYALLDQGDTEEAMSHFINAERIDPNDLLARLNLGVFYSRKGRLKEGIQELEAVVRLTDGRALSTEDRGYRSSALIDLAFADVLSQQFDQALSNLEALDRFDPSAVDRTIRNVQDSLANTPVEANYLNLSLLLRVRGKNQEAASLLRQVVTGNPGYNKARDLLEFLDDRSQREGAH